MPPQIVIHRWNSRDSDAQSFKQITSEVLGRALEGRGVEEIFLWDSGGEYHSIEARGRTRVFVIHLYARARDNARLQAVPHKMWGFQTKMREGHYSEYLFEPSGDGLVIIEPETGYAVAELIGNNLYILFEITDTRSLREDARLGVYRKILREALVFLGGGFPTLEELFRGDFIVPDARLLRRMQEDIAQRRQEVVRRVTHAVALENQLFKLAGNTTESDQAAERLYNIPEIKSLIVRGGNLVLNTHTMYGTYPRRGTIHEYGEFRIELSFGGDGYASFKNLTRRPYSDESGSYGHPHVDRGEKNFWCKGEGSAILPLLRDYEFEAATLFALKAIESVNEYSDGANYLSVLGSFPVVDKRMEYPKKKFALDPETRRAFGKIFDQTLAITKKQLEGNLNEAKQAVKPDQAQILQGTLAATLETLLAQKPKIMRKKAAQVSTPPVTSIVQAQVSKIREMDNIADVSIEEDILKIKTRHLNALDTVSRVSYSIGSFIIEYDFRSGIVRFKNTIPLRGPRGNVLQAPQLTDPEGELPLGQLTSTIPELLGNLELETAVALSLEFLASFNGAEIAPEIFGQMRKAA